MIDMYDIITFVALNTATSAILLLIFALFAKTYFKEMELNFKKQLFEAEDLVSSLKNQGKTLEGRFKRIINDAEDSINKIIPNITGRTDYKGLFDVGKDIIQEFRKSQANNPAVIQQSPTKYTKEDIKTERERVSKHLEELDQLEKNL